MTDTDPAAFRSVCSLHLAFTPSAADRVPAISQGRATVETEKPRELPARRKSDIVDRLQSSHRQVFKTPGTFDGQVCPAHPSAANTGSVATRSTTSSSAAASTLAQAAKAPRFVFSSFLSYYISLMFLFSLP
jgi:hypothetical protein